MVTIDQIKQLREETGSAPTQIKKALEEAKGNVEKARELLRIWGKNVSIKKVSRETKAGLIESYVHPNAKTGVLLDIRCETDFVANSPEFRKWLSEAWADIVDHPLPDEKATHLRSGVHVSYDEKYSGFDSRSISVYFSKHAAPNRGSKEYQNTPPQLWKDEASIGRFWGYFGLKPLVWKVPLSYREAVCFSRTLRRFSSRGRPGQAKPMRTRVVYGQIYKNQGTSRTGLLRRRVVKVPVKRFPTVLGFITVSNGARMTRYLARVLTLE